VIKKLIPPVPSQVRDAVVQLVNQVYEQAQAGMWTQRGVRTTPQEIESLVQEQRLFVAQDTETQRIVGCIKVVRLPGEDSVGEFGMLAVDPSMRGYGMGKKLIHLAEDWAREQRCREMQLELVAPRDWHHPTREFTRKLYAKLGYVPQRVEPFEVADPQRANLLATECDTTIWRKPLI